MKPKVKIIAAYLPQFHQIPENDRWWGSGYTDWVGVKKAKPLFKGHIQPNIPLDRHFYSLDNPEEILHQIRLANDAGVYGFSIYHYWFNSNLQLLQKPSEIILEHKEWPIHYMFNWDNGSWKRTWSAIRGNDIAPEADIEKKDINDNGILAELKYGNKEDWKIHFDYLLPFFKDERYIKIDNKPVFGIYNPDNDSNTLTQMLRYWESLAVENEFPGLYIIAKNNHGENKITPYSYRYEPPYSGWENKNVFDKLVNRIKKWVGKRINIPARYDYERIWKRIISNSEDCNDSNVLYGAFVGYDDTPRRAGAGKTVVGKDSYKFEKYLSQLIRICERQGKEYIFMTAWNEWGEGAYLEPDMSEKFEYLTAIKRVYNTID